MKRIKHCSVWAERFAMLAVAALVCAAATGCRTLNTRHIVGERVGDDLSAELNGAWKIDDTLFTLRQTSPGELRAAYIEWDDDEGKFNLTEITAILSRLGDDLFISTVNEAAPEGEKWYQFSRLRLDGDTIVVWGARWEAFEKAVRAGELAGRIEGEAPNRSPTDIWLEAGKETLETFVRERTLGELFNVESPGVLVRVTKE